jgi:hypothetical protein
MPLMYEENTLQMEWCLSCHRNPGKNLRPTGEIYNMAWQGPSQDKPVWCGTAGVKDGVPTAETVSCTTADPSAAGAQVASLNMLPAGFNGQTTASDAPAQTIPASLNYVKFTDQESLGNFLTQQYHIRTPQELSSCETCHR